MQTLRDLRKQAGKTCAEVAQELKITKRAVYKYEHGDREINLDQVVELARIYDVGIADVVIAQINSRLVR